MASIAFIGLGNMGGPMAANLVKAGHKVIAFDLVEASRNQAKADGADIADSAVASVKGADVVITMLPAGKHVISVWTDVVPAMTKGALIIDCSTIDVESAKQAHALATKHGVASVDAPVSGGTGGARGATLTFMCGGEDKAFAAAKPVLENMGKKIVHCGGAGAGQAAKICNNMILGVSMIAVGEAFALAEKLGLSHQALFDVASTSSGQCWALTSYCPVPGPVPTSPANNDYKPGFASTLDGEGPDAGAGRGQGHWRLDAAWKACAGNLQGVRRRRPWRGGFLGDHPACPQPCRKIANDDIPGRPRLPPQTPHRLRCRGKGIPLAGAGAVQLGAGLVRRRTGAQSRQQGSSGAVDRRCRQQSRNQIVVRGAVAPLQPGRELSCARRGSSAATICCCCSAMSSRSGKPCWPP